MALIKCEECGKEFSDTLNTCPHCGFRGARMNVNTHYEPQQNNVTQSVDALCLAGGIVSICSFFLDFFGLVAITGIVLSVLGLERVKNTGANGKSWATAGIIIGAIEAVWKFVQLMSII